jgi:hypothetical protein
MVPRPLALVYLHFENALCFKHIELRGVRVHCSVLTSYIDDYFSLETRSHCLAFHVFSLSHQRVPTGDPDQRVPEDNLTPLTLSALCISKSSQLKSNLTCNEVLVHYTPLVKGLTG